MLQIECPQKTYDETTEDADKRSRSRLMMFVRDVNTDHIEITSSSVSTDCCHEDHSHFTISHDMSTCVNTNTRPVQSMWLLSADRVIVYI
jgi:hypothetical protein